MDLHVYPAKSEQVRWIERKEGAIILNQKTGMYHKLNDTATFIWQISNGTKTIEEISRIMAKENTIEEDRAKKDVCHIINYLKSVGLIKLFKDSKTFYPGKMSFQR